MAADSLGRRRGGSAILAWTVVRHRPQRRLLDDISAGAAGSLHLVQFGRLAMRSGKKNFLAEIIGAQ
jgi:hypothetical protein